MKNILIILFTISCTSVSLFGNGVYAFDDSSCGKNRSSHQRLRLHGLKDLENTPFILEVKS